ncbi:TspO/MBR family protein [Saccharopolyspora oryzae]|uniref:Tryptophan-rich sensory protein n=2 Tax=Saccharopolyspora oryzae TaxID=2997343 RepID=A0ABT4V6C8_9PSEU|nr:TspO/MBR family protein [Saccharopolyspora oryzae]MDA3629503.1 tryptophan-rich sensory protein [Saccharopolyspora oryzae]
MRCSKREAVAAAAVLIGAVLVVAVIGSIAAATSAEQYASLQQPPWAPPPWLFGPVWTVLYALMAVAGWRAWCAGPGRSRGPAMAWYGVNLVLNAAWTPLFFVAGQRPSALFEIVLLDVVIVVTAVLFWRRDRLAGVLLLPYLAWTLFATALNASIVALN